MPDIIFNFEKQKLITDAKRSLKNGKINKTQFEFITKSINSSDFDSWDINDFENFKEKINDLSSSFTPPAKSQLKTTAREKLKKGLINTAQYEYLLEIANSKEYENLTEKDFEEIYEKLEGLRENNACTNESNASPNLPAPAGEEGKILSQLKEDNKKYTSNEDNNNTSQISIFKIPELNIPTLKIEKKKKNKKNTDTNLQQLKIF